MHSAVVVVVRMLVIPIVAVVACAAGCEREEYVPLPTTTPSSSSRVPATRRALPTSDEVFGSRSTTVPTTVASAATTRSSLSDGGAAVARAPLETPDQTIVRMFELMQKQDLAGVRAMLGDPPPPDRLRSEVALVADRMNSGAKWQIMDSRTEGVAAVVIFRTTFADGKQEFTPIPLVNRYDRWRVLLGTLNPKKLSGGERSGINRLASWTETRLNELRGVPTTTKPATTPTAPVTR